MLVTYGQGECHQGGKSYKGQIILSEHRLYLKGSEGDLAQTYIPLEKIKKIRRTFTGLEIYVYPSLIESYVALIKGGKKNLSALLKDLTEQRGLKKRFLGYEWIDDEV